MIQTKIPQILFGGDYCPEQWDEKTVDKDIQLLKEANVNSVVLSVFTWAMIEPSEGEYHFEWLDKLMDKLYENGIYVCLATPTCAQPAWMSKKYPEIMPVDIAGRKRNHGMRVFFCVNSEKFREKAAMLAEQMGKRYKDFPGLIAWHVANEYGTYCYCDHCQSKFREWLKNKYKSIENLNEKWNTVFWGRQVYDFDEIMIPSELNDDYRFNPSVQLDYLRFVTDSTAECFVNEAQVLKKYTPDIPVYTNISGHIKNLDQYKMAETMEFVGWDNYPTPREDLSSVAMKHDLMRSLKGGKPYLIAEQSPNQQNWQPYNKVKRPGEMRTLAYQGIAHGGDGCFYFQMKQSIGGQEKFHGAVIGHSGSGDTRIYKEISSLGAELKELGNQLIGTTVNNKVAIYFDWDSWWDLENASGPSKDMNYYDQVRAYYKALYDQNIPVDIIPSKAELDKYHVVIAPAFYMINPSTVERIKQFVQEGGTLISTFRTGVVDESDRCMYGLAPGPLKEVLGVEVEETDALFPDESNTIVIRDAKKDTNVTYESSLLCDLINLKGAKAVGVYGEDFYAGTPCITKNNYGKGTAYYVGTSPSQLFLNEFMQKICSENEIFTQFTASENVEVATRESENEKFHFVINHNDSPATIDFGSFAGTNLLNGERVTSCYNLNSREVMIVKESEE